MIVGRLACRDPQRLLEQRVNVRRPDKFDSLLGGAGQRDVVLATIGHRHRVVLLRPVGFTTVGA